MRQQQLKSAVNKLSILSVYLLFLCVHLNFKYTFSESTFSAFSIEAYSSNHGKAAAQVITAAKERKPFVQKLRMNKRYVHQHVFEVYSLQYKLTAPSYTKADNHQQTVPPVFRSSFYRALLRGPPAACWLFSASFLQSFYLLKKCVMRWWTFISLLAHYQISIA